MCYVCTTTSKGAVFFWVIIMLHQYQYTDSQRNKQEDLARSIHSKEYDAHYAIDDVNILSELLSHLIVFDHKCFIIKSFTLNDIKHSMDSNKERNFNICITRYHEILNCRQYCKVWFEF